MKWFALALLGLAGVAVWWEPGGAPAEPPPQVEAESGGAVKTAPAPPHRIERVDAQSARSRSATAVMRDEVLAEAQEQFELPLDPDAGAEEFLRTSVVP